MRSRLSICLVVSTLMATGAALAGEEPKLLPRDSAGDLFPPLPPDSSARPKASPPRPRVAMPAPAGTVAVPVVIVEPTVIQAPAPGGESTSTPEGRSLDAAAKTDAASRPARPGSKPGPAAKASESVPIPAPAQIARATPEEAGQMFAAAEARLKALGVPDAKAKGENQAIREVLEERKRWLLDWRTAAKEHHDAEHPEPSPERQEVEARAELEKCKTLLDQMVTAPDEPLPEIFRSPAAKTPEARLAEMKEAIDAARDELKARAARLDALHAETGRAASGDNAALRARRDQLHQDFSTVTARRGEREAAVATAGTPEARDLAAERLANFEWEARATAEKLDTQEALIALAARRLDLSALLIQSGEARIHLSKKLLERMEWHYTTFAEGQRRILEQAVVLEQSRAALADDPILRQRSKKNAELLELESQVVAYEKADAATSGLSLQEQDGLADAARTAFTGLKKLVDDGNLSTLDVLRLKNEYRRIGPERDRVAKTALIASATELGAYENALSEAEVDIVNDSRDDRVEADSLLEKVGPSRRDEALAMLDELEAKHRGLLNRRRDILQKLAIRAESIHTAVLRRIKILDEENAFIRTHIFWVRDAEPVGKATLIRARGETGRMARALVAIAGHAVDRKRWAVATAPFLVAATLAGFLPVPLWLGRRWIDRRRVATPG